jgi:hypothetical protein
MSASDTEPSAADRGVGPHKELTFDTVRERIPPSDVLGRDGENLYRAAALLGLFTITGDIDPGRLILLEMERTTLESLGQVLRTFVDYIAEHFTMPSKANINISVGTPIMKVTS